MKLPIIDFLQLFALSPFLGRDSAEMFLNELEDLYLDRRQKNGYRRALIWYLHQIVTGIAPMFRLWRHRAKARNVAKVLPPEFFNGAGGDRRFRDSRWWNGRFVYVLLISAVLMAVAIGINARSDFFTRWRRPESLPVLIRPSVAVLGFSDSVGGGVAAPELSQALTEMFRTEMSTGGKVRSISGEDVAQMERDISRPFIGTLAKSSLTLIRKNIGADYVLSGFGPFIESGNLRFDVKVQDTRTGEIVASVEQTGPRETFLSMVSIAGAQLRGKLNGGNASSLDTASLRASLPEQPDIQRLYLKGLSSLRNLDAIAARDFLLKAAAAAGNGNSSSRIQSALAETWALLGYEKKAGEAAAKALKVGVDLSPEELISLQGNYYALNKSWPDAVNAYNSLWTIYRDNLDYAIHLARAQASAGKIDDAFHTIDEMRGLPFPLGEDPRIDMADAAVAEMKGDFKREQKSAAAAEDKASARGARILHADAQLQECWALNALGDRKKALDDAKLARETFVAVGDRGGEARALKNIADVMDDIPDHQQARTYYERALGIFREIGYESGAAVTLNNLGYTLRDLADLKGAREAFQESVTISRETGNDNFQAKGLNGLAGVLWRQGDLLRAIEIYTQARTEFQGIGNEIDAATVEGNVAIIFQQLGDLNRAQQNFEHSLLIIRKLGDRSGVARTLGNLGDLLLLRGDLNQAWERYEGQLSIADETKDDKQRAYALVGFGEVLTARGDLNSAKARLEEAISLRLKAGETGLAAEAGVPLAEVFLEQGDLTGAESKARQAVSQFAKENEPDDEAGANALLARSLFEQGRTEDARKTIEVAKKAVSESKDRGTQLSVSIEYARIRGADLPSGEVIRTLKSLLAEVRRCGFLGYELEVRLIMGKIEEKSGDLDGRTHLKMLADEATLHGFGLIARQAQ